MGKACRNKSSCCGMYAKDIFATIVMAATIVIATPSSIIRDYSRTPMHNTSSLEQRLNDPPAISDEFPAISEDKKGRVVTAVRKKLSAVAFEMTQSLQLRLGPATAADQFTPSLPILHSSEADRLVGVPPALTDLVTNDGADILATAYAPTDAFHADASPFDALLEGKQLGRFIPPLAKGDHDWLKLPLPASSFSSGEQKCLSTAIYFEARGESLEGQAAVAQVILNRVRNPAYPDGICGVVYQNANLYNRCQFSFACDGASEAIVDRGAYEIAREIAMAVTGGKIFLKDIGSSTHYFATYVRPDWADAMEKMTQIGSHIFYRTHDGGWG